MPPPNSRLPGRRRALLAADKGRGVVQRAARGPTHAGAAASAVEAWARRPPAHSSLPNPSPSAGASRTAGATPAAAGTSWLRRGRLLRAPAARLPWRRRPPVRLPCRCRQQQPLCRLPDAVPCTLELHSHAETLTTSTGCAAAACDNGLPGERCESAPKGKTAEKISKFVKVEDYLAQLLQELSGALAVTEGCLPPPAALRPPARRTQPTCLSPSGHRRHTEVHNCQKSEGCFDGHLGLRRWVPSRGRWAAGH